MCTFNTPLIGACLRAHTHTHTHTHTHYRYSRALGCSATPVYGSSTVGNAFVDFTTTTPWPCGVDISRVIVRHGSLIDAIQIIYKTYDGDTIVKDQHGGNGGVVSSFDVDLDSGERIIAVAGATSTQYVIQLTFVTRKPSGEILIYGPYGTTTVVVNTFLVMGKINSIFGRNDHYLSAIGFYYEEEGAHDPV